MESFVDHAIFASMIGSIFLFLIYLYFYFDRKELFLKYWSFAWMFYFFRMLIEFQNNRNFAPNLLVFFSGIFLFLSIFFLIQGTLFFIKNKFQVYLNIFLAIGFMIFSYFWILGYDHIYYISVSYLWCGTMYIVTGYMFLKHLKIDYNIRYFIGTIFILWGFIKLSYPFIHDIPVLLAYKYLVSTFFEFFVALSIIAIFLKEEQKRILGHQKNLEESETRFKRLYTYIPIPYMSLDEDGIFREVNKALLDTLEYEEKEIIGQPITKILHKDSISKFKVNFKKFKLNGFAKNVEFNMLTKSKKKFVANVQGGIQYDEDGKFIQTYCAFFDISEIKQVEEQLIKLSSAVEQSPVSIVITDLKGNIEYVNKKFNEITGYTFQEAIGQNPRILKTDDTPIELYENLWKTITTGKPWEGEFVNKKKNGELYYEHALIIPIKDSEGKTTNYLAVKEDITERKTFEQALVDSETKYRMMMEQASEGIILNDISGVIHEANETASKITGYSNEELVGKTISKFLQSKHQKILDYRIDELNKGKTIVTESDITNKKGDIVNIRISTKLLMGGIVQTIVSDITDLKKAEDLLLAFNNRLETNVKERTKELEKANTEIDDLLRIKTTFVNQLSHDLRTPLTPIITLLPILKKKVDDENAQELISVISNNVSHLRNLIIDTLNLSKLDSGHVEFNFEKVDLTKLIGSFLNDYSVSFSEKNITLVNKIKKPLLCACDVTRIKEVIDNITFNAIKFIPVNGSITFSAKELKHSIEIIICDTGFGMDEEMIDKIFDEFYKGDKSRHDMYSSGLGLSIVRRIVDRHSGSVWAESKGLGKGSSFHIKLPKEQKQKKTIESD